MKLREFVDTFNLYNKFNSFKFYFFEIYTRICFIFLLACSIFWVSWEFRNEITVFLLSFQKTFTLNKIFLVSNEIFEIFYYNICLCLWITLWSVCLGVILHLIFFIFPGLYKHEIFLLKKFLIYEIFFIFILPFILILIYIPFFWSLILLLQNPINDIGFHHLIELKSLFFFQTLFSLYVNLFFISQCFCLLFFIIWLDNKKITFFFKFRKGFYFSFLLLSTLITPPDILSQIIFMLFLIFIIEILCFYFSFRIITAKIKT